MFKALCLKLRFQFFLQRIIQDIVCFLLIRKEIRDCQNLRLWHEAWKRAIRCYNRKLYRTNLDAFRHFALTAQLRARVNRHFEPITCQFLQLFLKCRSRHR